uniref:Uncharacterized protein n=1 Tax=Glossina pallidipes TaxID=7398 RepID=A0A1A9ZL92_GLOPL
MGGSSAAGSLVGEALTQRHIFPTSALKLCKSFHHRKDRQSLMEKKKRKSGLAIACNIKLKKIKSYLGMNLLNEWNENLELFSYNSFCLEEHSNNSNNMKQEAKKCTMKRRKKEEEKINTKQLPVDKGLAGPS